MLLGGLPHVLETGQIDFYDWLIPGAVGLALLLAVLRWLSGRWDWVAILCAVGVVAMPPVILCLAGSVGGWATPDPTVYPVARSRLVVGLLSGRMLHGPAAEGFVEGPLWRGLARRFALRPLDAVDGPALRGLEALLVFQPRALAPEELVALDGWVRMGGRAVLLVDPDLRWADARTPSDYVYSLNALLLSPLLAHWGLVLAPAPPEKGGDPVQRRRLDDGQMIQIAGASHFIPSRSGPVAAHCRLSSGGLVARCAVGRGQAILVADADFAQDSLWTIDPERPERTGAWTSDTLPILADFLAPGAGGAAGRRMWLARADGVTGAVRAALCGLLVVGLAMLFSAKSPSVTKAGKGSVSQKP